MTDSVGTIWLVHVQRRYDELETRTFVTEEAARVGLSEAIAELYFGYGDSAVADSDIARLDFLREHGKGAWLESSVVRS